MIRDGDRKLVMWLIRLRIWKLYVSMRCVRVHPRKGTRWLYEWMKRRQEPDKRHHAPACPANRWSGMALVLQHCNCGAPPSCPACEARYKP